MSNCNWKYRISNQLLQHCFLQTLPAHQRYF